MYIPMVAALLALEVSGVSTATEDKEPPAPGRRAPTHHVRTRADRSELRERRETGSTTTPKSVDSRPPGTSTEAMSGR